jgi:putative FmdB family regulatory protein
MDVFQTMSDKPLTECAECHGKLKRLIGAGAGFLFKGSGFYATDYRSDSYKQAQKQASSSSATAASPTTTSATAPTAATAPPAGSSTTAATSTQGGATEKQKP